MGSMADGKRPNAAPDLSRLAAELAEVEGVTVAEAVPAGAYCTYRVGGEFAVLATVSTSSGLVGLASLIAAKDARTLTIGRGSNLLVSDAGFSGVAIHLDGDFDGIEIEGTTVTVGAAADLPRVARATVKAGLTGFEWAVGVPGSIGGAVRMNAGGHGSDVAASLVSAEIVDLHLGGMFVRPADSLELAYRHSNVTAWQLVVSATLELEKGDPEAGQGLLSEIVAWRREHQPGGANSGSVFTNPDDDSAGRLIDAAGCKGMRIGSAHISQKHANFIQVDAGGAADDVMALMVQIVERVRRKQGVVLSAETQLVGFPPEIVAKVQHGTPKTGETWSARSR